MNKVRIGFRAECRTKVRNKYARLNTDGADAYVIGVLHAHKEQNSPSGCDENGVHREHTLRTEAILYAVDRINERKDILPNITLGAIIIDSCYITDKIVQQIVEHCQRARQSQEPFRITFCASGHDRHKLQQPNYRCGSDDSLAPTTAPTNRELIQQANYKGMRVAYQVQLDDTITNDEKGLDYVFRHFIMSRMSRVKVIVAFLRRGTLKRIFLTAQRNNVTGLVWVGSDSFTDSDTAATSRFALGSIGVVFHTGILDDFGRYIDSINARKLCPDGKSHIGTIPSMMTEVIFNGSSGEQIMFDSKGDGVGRYDFINLIDHSGFEAVVAALWAVDRINENGLLPEATLGIAVYDTCSNLRQSPPDGAGGVRLVFHQISMTSSILPKDLASDDTFFRTVPPTDAEIQLIIQLLKRLGWDYVHLVYSASLSKNATAKRFVADASSQDVCVATKVPLHSYWKGLDRYVESYNTLVESLRSAGPPLYHHLSRAIGIVMISLLCLGIGFTALLIFYLVKLTSSRRVYLELSTDATVTLIVGVLLLYLSNITFLFSATNGTCGVRRVCLGMAYCLCFSGQLLDVARLALLMQLKPDAPAHDVLKAKRVHIYLPVLLAGQIVPTTFWLLLEPSGALLDVPPPQDVASLKEVLPTWRCKIDRYELVLSLVYDAVLLLHTMILAFMTRHVTSGHGVRPARSVLMSTVVSAIIWVAWIPLYLHVENNDAYLALVSVGISLDATFMLGITFMPKVVKLMDNSADNPLRDVPWNPQPTISYRKILNVRRGSTEINERQGLDDGGSGQSSRHNHTSSADRPSNVTSLIRVKGRGINWKDRRGGSFRRILPPSPGKSAVLQKRAKFKDERHRASSFESSEGIYC
ncbi:metabotropic glutamate receptor 8-like [Liolophura sinensis]|uniref:metabotropic glutamate receptor 8-like n=1 Tax=Liolophura sinensis TaxID=3198878 RepID=UPI003157F53A